MEWKKIEKWVKRNDIYNNVGKREREKIGEEEEIPGGETKENDWKCKWRGKAGRKLLRKWMMERRRDVTSEGVEKKEEWRNKGREGHTGEWIEKGRRNEGNEGNVKEERKTGGKEEADRNVKGRSDEYKYRVKKTRGKKQLRTEETWQRREKGEIKEEVKKKR